MGVRELPVANDASGLPAEAAVAAHERIVRACLFAGLAPMDAEDLAQDIFLWFLRSRQTAQMLTVSWMRAVTINFIKRHWRERKRRDAREGQAAATAGAAGRRDGTEETDMRISFDEMERRLPPLEAKLLHLVRRGVSFAEAAFRLGIPRGSRDYHRKALLAHLAAGLHETRWSKAAPQTTPAGTRIRPRAPCRSSG